MEDAGEVYGEGAVPVGGRLIEEVGFDADTGVGDDDVGWSGTGERGVKRVAAGDVSDNSASSDLRGCLSGILAIEDTDSRAGCRKQAGGGESDAIGAAGDDGELVAESEVDAHSTTGTSLESMIRWWEVIKVRPCTRAVATMARSEGSRRYGPIDATSRAISNDIGKS